MIQNYVDEIFLPNVKVLLESEGKYLEIGT